MKTTRWVGARWIAVGTVAVVAGIGCRQIFGLNPGTLGTDLCTDPMTGNVITCPPDGGGGGSTGKPCSVPSDCPAGNDCETAACTGGVCGLVATNEGMACGTVAGQVCKNGQCTCMAPASTCAGSCVDTTSDAANCGGCGKTCPAGVSCVTSACDCPDGGTVCATACTDTSTDAMNCGACGKTCTAPLSACSGSNCVCPGGEADCGGTCIDTSGDAKNCGACGHDCLGSACQGGLCQPTVLASEQANPSGLAINGTYLVWANTSKSAPTVMKMLIGGATPTTVVASAPDLSTFIAIDDANVYWFSATFNFSYLYSSPLGGGATTTIDNNCGASPGGLALQGTTLYWTCGTFLDSAPTSGTNAIALASGLGNGPGQVAVDKTSVYCVELGGKQWEKWPFGGGPATASGTNPTTKLGVAIVSDGTNVYWGPGLKTPVGGGTTTTLGASFVGAYNLAVDTSNVYAAIAQTNGTIVRAPIDGSPGVTVAINQNSPYGIVVDSTYVYWTNSGDGTVMRVAK